MPRPDDKGVLMMSTGDNKQTGQTGRPPEQGGGWAAVSGQEEQGVKEAVPADADYTPAQTRSTGGRRRWWVGLLAILGLVFGKFKILLGPLLFLVKLLKLGKFLTTGLSMVLMIVSYTFFYGWKFAAGIVGLIFVHEMGHMVFARLRKLDVSWPVFIPFLGAFIKMKEQPRDAKTEAFVAIGGPLIGMLGAFVCLGIAALGKSTFWAALAYFGFFITVFNMIPAHPLDGGRIAAALSPLMWVAGIAAMLIMTIYFFNPIALIILVMATVKAWKVWKHRDELPPGYYEVDAGFRLKMGLTYFAIFAVSSFFTYLLHEILQGQ